MCCSREVAHAFEDAISAAAGSYSVRLRREGDPKPAVNFVWRETVSSMLPKQTLLPVLQAFEDGTSCVLIASRLLSDVAKKQLYEVLMEHFPISAELNVYLMGDTGVSH